MTFNIRTMTLLRRWFLTVILGGLCFGAFIDLNTRIGELTLQSGRMMRSYMAFGFFSLLVVILVLLQIWNSSIFSPFLRIRKNIGAFRWLIIILLAFSATYFFLYSKWGHVFSGINVRLIIYLFILGLMSWLAVSGEDNSFEWEGLLVSIILFGSVYSLGQVFSTVSSYPFSIGWSEGNRLWDYSIRYGSRLYLLNSDQTIPVYTDGIRQSLWGLPYLVLDMTIWQARFWSSLVWTLPYAILGWIFLVLGKKRARGWFIFGLWVFLFLNQGPIYSTLVLAAILVASCRRTSVGLSLLLLIFAGTYARMSRYSWIFAPSIWAFLILYLQNPGVLSLKSGWREILRTLRKPALLAIFGFMGSYGLVRTLTYLLRGQDTVRVINTSWISTAVSRQALLWDRLWPNSTYPLGIVLGLILAAGPLMIFLFYLVISKKWKLDFWQGLALLGAQAAFFVVGIIASVKIGGGSNLHNFDMFLIGMVFAVCLAWENGLRDWISSSNTMAWWSRLLILMIVCVPAVQGMFTTPAQDLPNLENANVFMETLQKPIADASELGEVLFLDQRQLLTFGFIKNIPLVADYEKKLLMDEAMAGEQKYFSNFYKDLASHRFSIIISEPLWVRYQGGSFEFGNENDAWVKWVSIPILCYYRPLLTDERFSIQLLIPKPKLAPAQDINCP